MISSAFGFICQTCHYYIAAGEGRNVFFGFSAMNSFRARSIDEKKVAEDCRIPKPRGILTQAHVFGRQFFFEGIKDHALFGARITTGPPFFRERMLKIKNCS
jgi:hypothetical protein